MVDIAANPNASTIEAWNTVLFEKFCRYQFLLIEGLGQHGREIFKRFPPPSGGQVVDIGCGFGDTTAQLAELVGRGGRVVGVDCAANFIAAAEKRAAEHGVADRVEFVCGDVQRDDLGGPYGVAYSRFGTMFFDSPVPALRNIRKSLAPDGFVAMSVWRKRQDNPCFYIAQQVVEQFISEDDKATDQVTCGPGPFSMASPDLVSDQLLAAGFCDAQFLRFDAPMCIGRTIDEAIHFARDIGPAGEAIRLAADKAGGLSGEIERALRDAFADHLRDDGVWAQSSTWLITARPA